MGRPGQDDGHALAAAALESGARRGRGRPRDPGLENKALRATLDIFGERGWAGLTMDEVAARARVGKSSIYLRWRDKATLLTDALRWLQTPPARVDPDEPAGGAAVPDEASPGGEPADTFASLRKYLIEQARHRATLYLGPHGLAMLRLYLETRALPEVFTAIRQQALTDFVLAERHRVEAAIRAGVLPTGTSAVQLLDVIEGAVFVHVLVTPPELLDQVRENLRRYVEELVDGQLRAVSMTVASTAWAPAPASGAR